MKTTLRNERPVPHGVLPFWEVPGIGLYFGLTWIGDIGDDFN